MLGYVAVTSSSKTTVAQNKENPGFFLKYSTGLLTLVIFIPGQWSSLPGEMTTMWLTKMYGQPCLGS